MDQQGDKWLSWRREGIGSSDVAAVLGISPWKSQSQLLTEKKSQFPPEEKSNYIQEKGKRMEPKARAIFELRQGKSFLPATIQMEAYPFLRASLDGWTEDRKEISEFKLVGKKKFEEAAKGIVPEYYMCQIQHQLLVSGAELAWYVPAIEVPSSDGRKVVHIEMVRVEPDVTLQRKIFEECLKFWSQVRDQL